MPPEMVSAGVEALLHQALSAAEYEHSYNGGERSDEFRARWEENRRRLLEAMEIVARLRFDDAQARVEEAARTEETQRRGGREEEKPWMLRY